MFKKAALFFSNLSLLVMVCAGCAGDMRIRPPSAEQQDAPSSYRHDLGLSPQDAQYYQLVADTLPISQEAAALLAQNGFVVSDEQAWDRFLDAYAWIYWQDLPVLITTDSILQAVNQSYDDLLKEMEQNILIPRLLLLLQATRAQLQTDRLTNSDPDLDPLYTDVATYLDIAVVLMEGKEKVDGDEQRYLDWALAADSHNNIDLFGPARAIDFTMLQPRGHYSDVETDLPESVDVQNPLAGYFRAMSWLAQVDFRFVDYDSITSEPVLHKEAIAAALILSQTLAGAGQRQTWDELDGLLKVLVGRSDNLTLTELDQFIRVSGLGSPAAVLSADSAALLQTLNAIEDGRQRIKGQITARHTDNASPQALPLPISFMLMGQRFVVDSFIMSNLVYDRLFVNGRPVQRALPDPLDVAYALGNDRAKEHLADELARYRHGEALQDWQDFVADLDPAFWEAPIYNQWLRLIRSLNVGVQGEGAPAAMQTAAWADKMLQTQLASWAQLRHHHILYAKQSFSTSQIVCAFPDAYVEPYPAFFQALADYAAFGQAALQQIDVTSLSADAFTARRKGMDYFEGVGVVAERLGAMAEKELRGERLSAEDMAFVQNAVVRHVEELGGGCGGPRFQEEWDGWYRGLFYEMDRNPALIVDVHTNTTVDPASKLYPPRVLHVATGPVSPVFLIVDRGEGPILFVGPAFTYFQVVESGDATQPPARLTDEQWRMRLRGANYPQPPVWTASFRIPTTWPPKMLWLPMESIEP